MRPDDVLEFLQHRPFQSFRVTLTDGRTYDVRHPEMAMVGRSSMVIGLPAPGDAARTATAPIYDRAVTVSMLHVMQLESLDAANSSNT